MRKTAGFVKSLKRPASPSIGGLLEQGRQELHSLGAEEAKASSERLLEEVLELERSALYVYSDRPVTAAQAKRYRLLIRKRQKRIPVAYILRKAYFWDEVLEVDESCLIPRPETEILVDSFIRFSGFTKESRFSFLDLGCGSGAIAIAILRHFPKANAVLSDISAGALRTAKKNLKTYGLLERSKTVKSDCFSALRKNVQAWDAVISNPPYVADEDFHTLEPELGYEPETALRGGSKGLSFYRKISAEAKTFLKPGGLLVFEMGAGQSGEIKKFAVKQGYQAVRIFKDYLNIDRVLMARVSSELNRK